VLPQVINENQVFIFKFWFSNTIRYGMYYQNELFCRLNTYPLARRAHAYQLACKLNQQNAVVLISCTPDNCSLWGSLRSPLVKDLLVKAGSASPSSTRPANPAQLAKPQPTETL